MHHLNKASKLPIGTSLKDGEAHERHHQDWSRRTFLKNLGLAGTGAMLLGKIPVSALANNPLSQALADTSTDRVLVLIRLKGGNDGLNTIVPLFDYGTYTRLRPTLAIPRNEVLALDDGEGIPNTMEPLMRMWQDGQMKVAHNIGYADQNLSHFRSSDIWASASDADVFKTSGWLGRYINDTYPDFIENPPEHPPAIQIGGTGNLIFNNASMFNLSMVVSSPEELAEIAETGQLFNTNNVPECHYGDQIKFVRAVANTTFRYADVISDSYEKGKNNEEYAEDLGAQLALVARMIKGGLRTRLYMVSIDGFDTHANQLTDHPKLMNTLAQAVRNFYDDLATADLDKKVLSMSISEFGRRIEQNGSNGTDHGAAAPMMLFGPGLEGNGFVGERPNFQDLDENGNLKFEIDFRSVYSTVLENWLCIDSNIVDQVMGRSFPRIPALGLACLATSTNSRTSRAKLQYKLYNLPGEVKIQYQLPESGPVRIYIFDILGRKVADLQNGYQTSGTHEVVFNNNHSQLVAANYVLHIDAGRYMVSEQFGMIR